MNLHLAFRIAMPTVLLCVAGPGIVRAQHADVLIQQSNGVLVTGNANFDNNTWTTGRRVFSGEFDGDFAVNNPGYNALAAGSPSMPAGTQPLPANTALSWDFLAMAIAPQKSNLFYWNGLESDGQPGITAGDVHFGALPLPTYTLSLFDKTNTAYAVNGAGSDAVGGVIDDTAADGSLHRHRFYFLQDNDGNGATVPADGIYLFAMSMKMTGLATSKPIFMVFGTLGSSIAALDDAAVPWVQARVDSLVPLAGDYNQNGTVDAADYIIWRNTLGQTGSGLAADGDGDNLVDGGDYAVWRSNFGHTTSMGSVTTLSANSIPEPNGVPLIVLSLSSGGLGRRRRRSLKLEPNHPEKVCEAVQSASRFRADLLDPRFSPIYYES